MGLLNKATYLTALLRLLPFGLAALLYGGNGLINNRSADSLLQVDGKIVFSGVKKIYSEGSLLDAFVFQIEDSMNDTTSCFSFYKGYKEKLHFLVNKNGEHITIWVDNKNGNEIMQVKYQNQLIIKYDGRIYLYLFFLILGGIYTFITVGYLIKHPEHLFTKKGKREEGFVQTKNQKITDYSRERPKPGLNKEIPFGHYEHCPACGYKLKETDKECPDCGLNLS